MTQWRRVWFSRFHEGKQILILCRNAMMKCYSNFARGLKIGWSKKTMMEAILCVASEGLSKQVQFSVQHSCMFHYISTLPATRGSVLFLHVLHIKLLRGFPSSRLNDHAESSSLLDADSYSNNARPRGINCRFLFKHIYIVFCMNDLPTLCQRVMCLTGQG